MFVCLFVSFRFVCLFVIVVVVGGIVVLLSLLLFWGNAVTSVFGEEEFESWMIIIKSKP